MSAAFNLKIQNKNAIQNYTQNFNNTSFYDVIKYFIYNSCFKNYEY